jgi:sulfatase maturation enzyme AslB (radical SAM superfamily)
MKNKNTHCPMIHGGLNINHKDSNGQIGFNQSCLSTVKLEIDNSLKNIWNNQKLKSLREQNKNNIWDKDCWECERLESANQPSFRMGMLNKFGVKEDLSGPQRIDLLFDLSCNLACRTCGPNASTFWQKHLKENNMLVGNYPTKSRMDDIIKALNSLDLSNLEMVQYCGGETLMGNTYWETTKILADLIPNAKDKITLGFQTNGTQLIDEKHYDLIEKFHLVKFIISLDGVGDRFNYMRWPANWNQVSDNILAMRENLPVNVMFIIQETASNLNLFYHDEVSNWVEQNFSTNRLGDITNYSKHLVIHQNLDINNITKEYYDAISSQNIINLLSPNWQENPENIKRMIEEVEMYDRFRNQNWRTTFPEVAEFYSRYL